MKFLDSFKAGTLLFSGQLHLRVSGWFRLPDEGMMMAVRCSANVRVALKAKVLRRQGNVLGLYHCQSCLMTSIVSSFVCCCLRDRVISCCHQQDSCFDLRSSSDEYTDGAQPQVHMDDPLSDREKLVCVARTSLRLVFESAR